MALLAVLACYFMVRIVHKATYNNYLLAALCAGLAISTKYNAGMILGGFAVVHWLANKSLKDWRHHLKLLCASLVCLGAFLLGSPYSLLSFGEYYQALVNVKSNTQFALQITSCPWLNLFNSIWQTEWVWGALGTLGCVYALYRRNRARCGLAQHCAAHFSLHWLLEQSRSALHYFSRSPGRFACDSCNGGF